MCSFNGIEKLKKIRTNTHTHIYMYIRINIILSSTKRESHGTAFYVTLCNYFMYAKTIKKSTLLLLL